MIESCGPQAILQSRVDGSDGTTLDSSNIRVADTNSYCRKTIKVVVVPKIRSLEKKFFNLFN